MKKVISLRSAGIVLLVIFGLLVVFHVLVLFQLLPSNIVWGGQIGGSTSSLRTLEIVSLSFTMVFAVVIAAKIGYIKAGRFMKVINVFLWIIFAYLLLNTVGNLASSSFLEKLVFIPTSIVAAFLVLRLAIEK
jgi:hypothetical protein